MVAPPGYLMLLQGLPLAKIDAPYPSLCRLWKSMGETTGPRLRWPGGASPSPLRDEVTLVLPRMGRSGPVYLGLALGPRKG